MKLFKQINVLSLVALAFSTLLVGCKGPSSEIGPPMVRLGVSTGATYALMEHPEALPAVRASADVICSQAAGTNLSPTSVVAAINAYTKQTPESILIVNSALGLYTLVWNGYGAEAVKNDPLLRTYLQATCDGLQDALAGQASASRNAPSFGAAPPGSVVWPLVHTR